MKALVFIICFTLSSSAYSQNLFDWVKANDLNSVRNYSGPVNLRDENQATPLMWSAYKADMAVFRQLIKKGADIDMKGWILHRDTINNYEFIYGSTMAIAAGENNTRLIHYLIKNELADADDREINLYENKENGWTGLHWAAVKGNVKAAKILLKHGADINSQAQTDFNQTALILAINFEQIEMVRYLVDKGANINQGDMYGVSVLSYAFDSESAEVVKLLILAGAEFNPIENKLIDEQLKEVFGVASIDDL